MRCSINDNIYSPYRQSYNAYSRLIVMDIGIIKLDIGYSYLFSDFVAQTLEL